MKQPPPTMRIEAQTSTLCMVEKKLSYGPSSTAWKGVRLQWSTFYPPGMDHHSVSTAACHSPDSPLRSTYGAGARRNCNIEKTRPSDQNVVGGRTSGVKCPIQNSSEDQICNTKTTRCSTGRNERYDTDCKKSRERPS